jgi:excisionase family DNA binding protein
MLGIGRSTLYELLGDDEIETIRVGRRRLFRAFTMNSAKRRGYPGCTIATGIGQMAAYNPKHPSAASDWMTTAY